MTKNSDQTLIDNIVKQSSECNSIFKEDLLDFINLYQEQKMRDARKDKMLEQHAKMASMGEMMDAVAHQWKQPLNALSMMSDLLKDDFEDGLVDKAYIYDVTDTANNQIEHLLTTLSEFRTFFRPSKDENRDFHIYNCIKSVQVLMKDELIINNIIIYIKIEEDLMYLGRENEFKHLFINLLNNAIDIFEERKKSVSRHVYIRAYTEGTKIYIEFEDNAGGIDETIINDVFKPHITTKEEKKGSGIGLYMSSQIVQKHNGKIDVHNSNMGALFTITLNS